MPFTAELLIQSLMFFRVELALVKKWWQKASPSTDEWVKKMWHMRSEWNHLIWDSLVEIEVIMINEKSQAQKDKHCTMLVRHEI